MTSLYSVLGRTTLVHSYLPSTGFPVSRSKLNADRSFCLTCSSTCSFVVSCTGKRCGFTSVKSSKASLLFALEYLPFCMDRDLVLSDCVGKVGWSCWGKSNGLAVSGVRGLCEILWRVVLQLFVIFTQVCLVSIWREWGRVVICFLLSVFVSCCCGRIFLIVTAVIVLYKRGRWAK